jgi:hypothetical protein
MSQSLAVALETGKSRTFASALDWPGWARSGRDEAAALDALFAYGPRYQRAIRTAKPGFRAPTDVAAFEVTERLPGNATTNFGTPGMAPSIDASPLDDAGGKRALGILAACWTTFGHAVESAEGKPLRKGPRGGGRSTSKIVGHVIEAHYEYLRKISWREPHEQSDDVAAALKAVKEADARALAFAISGEMPSAGPRGGALWKPRYFVRRAAWHILDHAWEIEDRLES